MYYYNILNMQNIHTSKYKYLTYDKYKFYKEDILSTIPKHKHKIISKYLDILPERELQLKYIIKYDVDPSLVILINFMEITFNKNPWVQSNVINKHGNREKSFGPYQIYSKYYTWVLEYDMKNMKSSCKESYFNNSFKQIISRNKHIDNMGLRLVKHNMPIARYDNYKQSNYYKEFRVRTASKKYNDLRKLL